MLRRSALILSFAVLVFLGALIISCGGSGSGSGITKGCTGSYNVVGDWQGSLSSGGGSSSVAGVINTSGLAVFIDDSPAVSDPASGSVLVMPTISGACSITGTATAYGSFGVNGGTGSASVQGSVSSASSISAQLTSSNGTGTLTLSSFSPLSGSAKALSGTTTADIQGGAGLFATITPTGTGASMTITNTAASLCAPFNGTFTQEGSNNIFDVSITFIGSGAGCPTAGTVTGLGFESNSDYFNLNSGTVGTYLYGVSSGSAFVLEVFPIS